MARILLTCILLFPVILSSCAQPTEIRPVESHEQTTDDTLQKAYFAAGCFWCVEAIFESIYGVHDVISGYSGGPEKFPTYRQVASGTTGHAETVKIIYDSTIVSYETLLSAFFGSHDPSTLNRQGPDTGRQYRSAIFYCNEYEKKLAEKYIRQLLKEKKYNRITTEVSVFTYFYPAEDYHQDFEQKNPTNPYIQNVSHPRFESFRSNFPQLLKKR